MKRPTAVRPRVWAVRGALAAVVLLMLVPYFRAGFFFDDIYNSVVRGQLLSTGQSLPQFVLDLLRMWVVVNGRFFPVAILSSYPLWDVADSLLKARVVQCGLAALDIWALYALTRRLADSKVAAVAVLMLPLLVQFNPRWDGLSSFSPLNQLVVLCCLLGCLAAIRACETGAIRHVAASVAAVTLGLLTYEIGVVGWMGAIAIGLAHRRTSPVAAGRLLRAQAAAGLVYFAIYAAFRAAGGTGYEGVHSGRPAEMVGTFFAQLLSAFPFAYLANTVLPPAPAKPGAMVWVCLLLVCAWVLALTRRTSQARAGGRGSAWLLGAALSCVPALVISVSARYQQIVHYGDPYIVVYMQYFGVALLLALAGRPLYAWAERGGHWRSILLSLPLSAGAALTIAANYQRIDLKNDAYRWPREQMEHMVQGGLLDRVPAHSLLLVQSPHIWENESDDVRSGLGLCAAFFSQHAHKPLRCARLDTFLRDVPTPGKDGAPVFILRRLAAHERQGAAELIGTGWEQLATVDRAGRVRLAAVDARTPAVVTLGTGFYGWEPEGAQDFAWASGPAQLIVYSLSTEPARRRLEFRLQSAQDQRITVRDQDGVIFDGTLKEAGEPSVQADVVLRPGRNVIAFEPSAAPIKMPNGDPRTFSFRVLRPEVR